MNRRGILPALHTSVAVVERGDANATTSPLLKIWTGAYSAVVGQSFTSGKMSATSCLSPPSLVASQPVYDARKA